jgi:putative transposase
MMAVVLLRLAYLGVTNALALLRLMPMSDRDKDTEILVLRHEIAILQRQLGAQRPRFDPGDRVLLAARQHRLPKCSGLGVRAGRVRCAPSASWPVAA